MKPRVIKTEEDYRISLAEVERLVALDPEPGSPNADALDLLATLVGLYEEKHFPFENPDPVEAILFRMEQQGLKQRDLLPCIGSKSKVSEVLSRKRPLSLNMMRALSEQLGIPAHVLLGAPQPKGVDSSEPEREKNPPQG